MQKSIKFWFKYILIGCFIALFYLLFIANNETSIKLRQWIAHRFIYSVQPSENTISHQSYAKAVGLVTPSVVSIRTASTRQVQSFNPLNQFFNIPQQKSGYEVDIGIGSGVIFNKKGYLLTNYHVVENKEFIEVTLHNNRKKMASLVGYDEITDLAVLHIDMDNLTPVAIDPNVKVQPGDIVLALGNPLQLNHVTLGVASGKTRIYPENLNAPKLLQIDAAINPGNSGGALINSQGELVGIPSRSIRSPGGSQLGINFAIPVDTVDKITRSIIQHGKMIRGWLGFNATLVTELGHKNYAPDHIPYNAGLLVTAVDPQSPAAQGKLQKEDFISHYNGQLITSVEAFLEDIQNSAIGSPIELTIYRKKEKQHLILTVAEQP